MNSKKVGKTPDKPFRVLVVDDDHQDAYFVTSALKELGVTPSQQGAGAGDFALVAEVFDGVLSELQAKELAAWGSDGTPDEAENAPLFEAKRDVLDDGDVAGRLARRRAFRARQGRRRAASPRKVPR